MAPTPAVMPGAVPVAIAAVPLAPSATGATTHDSHHATFLFSAMFTSYKDTMEPRGIAGGLIRAAATARLWAQYARQGGRHDSAADLERLAKALEADAGRETTEPRTVYPCPSCGSMRPG